MPRPRIAIYLALSALVVAGPGPGARAQVPTGTPARSSSAPDDAAPLTEQPAAGTTASAPAAEAAPEVEGLARGPEPAAARAADEAIPAEVPPTEANAEASAGEVAAEPSASREGADAAGGADGAEASVEASNAPGAGDTDLEVAADGDEVVAAVTATAAGCSPCDDAEAGAMGELVALVDGAVRAYRREHLIPGVVVSVVLDGKPAFARGYGFADVEAGVPVDPEATLFRIGSVSKTFIWTAVMMLAERGQLDLDSDVRGYLGGLELPLHGDEPITLNQLMTHRAGFEDTLAIFTHADGDGVSLADRILEDRPERVMDPGSRTSYSNWGSSLAALVVQKVSGQPFEAFMQEEILDPLGMGSTTLRGPSQLPPELRARLATGYGMKAGFPEPEPYLQVSSHAPIGAISTTASDMTRWMAFHLGGGALDDRRLLSASTHATLWRRPFADRPAAADLVRGFMHIPMSDRWTFGHGGATSTFLSNMTLVPERGLGLFVSQSTTDSRPLIEELAPLVVAALAGQAPDLHRVASAPPMPESGRAEYAGTYLPNRRSFTRFDKLFAALSPASVATASAAAGLTVVLNGKPARFVPVDGAKDTFEDALGRRIFFGRDEGGGVAYLAGPMGVHTYEKTGLLDDPQVLVLVFLVALLFSFTTWSLAVRRAGRKQTHSWLGAIVRWIGLAGSLAVVALLVALVWTGMTYASFRVTDLDQYPPLALVVLQTTARVVFGAGIVALLTLVPAWRGSGFGKALALHHTLWALATATLAAYLALWNLVFAPFV